MVMPKKEPTKLTRIKKSDLVRLRYLAKKAKKSLPDYIAQITRGLK